MDVATTHLSADLDGLASLVALSLVEGPAELVLPGSMDATTRLFFSEHKGDLPPFSPLGTTLEKLKALGPGEAGRLLVVDTADPERIGALGPLVSRFREVRAWDTHPPAATDLPRADMPGVGACTSAWVLRLVEEGIRPSHTAAGLFLLGIHADTGHFTFPGTTPLDHEAAATCLSWGASPEWVGRYVPKGFTREQLKLLEAMGQSADLVEVAGTRVAILQLETTGYVPDLAVLVEQLRSAENWPVAILLAGGGERVSLIGRSTGQVDVGEVLRPLGGGGHAEAASAALKGMTLRDARTLLEESLREVLGHRRTALDLAVRDFLAVPMTTPIREVADLLHQRRFNSLPLTRGRKMVGLVSRQEVDSALRHGLGDRPAGEISAGPPTWIAPEAPLVEARDLLVSGPRRLLAVGHAPDEAMGILTRGTVFRALEEPKLAGRSRPPRPQQVLTMLEEGLGHRWQMVERLGKVAGEMGVHVHLVGGSVRDLFLGLEVRDVDLVVEGAAPRIAREAARRFGGEVRVHETFGTATWTDRSGRDVDLASARSEHYEAPAALPTVALHAGLRQDLFRRDFTLNAIAISVDPSEAGRVHDPFGGLADLKAGVLRVLHGLSFHDDPTRAFRAVRFAARFDFKLAPETLSLLQAARKVGVFEKLSRERLGTELEHILSQQQVVQAFRLIRELSLAQVIHPAFHVSRTFLERLGDVRAARERVAGFLPVGPSRADVLWLVLASGLSPQDRRSIDRMVPGGAVRRRRFLEGPEKARGLVGALGRIRRTSVAARILETLDEVEMVYALGLAADRRDVRERIEWWLKEGRHIEAAIDGRDLLAEGHAPGPKIGKALKLALDAARDGADEAGQLRAATRALGKAGQYSV